MKRLLGVLVCAAMLFGGSIPASAEKVSISFWHVFGGGRTAFIQRMVDDFNYTHPNIEVQVEYKGSYRDTLNASLLAAKQGSAPHIVQY